MITCPVAGVLTALAFVVGFALGRRRPGRRVVWSEPVVPIASPEVEGLLRRGRKIEAIRRYRELHGTDLKASREAVEALERQLAPEPRADAHRDRAG